MHEYGHYMQSQDYGFGYLFIVGIPSFLDLAIFDGKEKNDEYEKHDLKWFEIDANQRGYHHFYGKFGTWDELDKKYPLKYPL